MRPCHDQFQRWCEGHLGNDLLADLVECGHLLDFPLHRRLMRLQAPRHVVKGLGQDAYLVVGIMFYSNGTLTSRNTIRRFGQTSDRLCQVPDAVDGEQQCDPQAEGGEDSKRQRDHPLCVLELLQRIDEVEHNSSQEGGRLMPLTWLVQWYGSSHCRAKRRQIDLLRLQGA